LEEAVDPYRGSLISRIQLRLALRLERIERAAPRMDWWGLWIGLAITLTGATITWLHWWIPDLALTESLITWIGGAIRTVHGWILIPVGDLMTYLGLIPVFLSILLLVVRRWVRSGGTKSP
jgi:hypothetical protein